MIGDLLYLIQVREIMSDHGFRVFKAIGYIDQNLFTPMDLESIARAGAFSSFHFHRVFTSLMGLSVADYVRKRRLSEAARRLLHTDQEILDLAIECQYESQESFTRAFKKAYEVTPGQLRKMKKSIEIERPLSLDDINALIKGDAVKPEIVEQEDMRVIGIAKLYGKYDFQGAHDHWDQFMSRLLELKSRKMDVLLGIGLDSHPDLSMSSTDKYVYLTGVEVGPDEILPTGMTETLLPKAKYAKFTHRGHLADSGNTVRKIWNIWIPESGLNISEGTTIEVYGEKFNVAAAESEFDILIPIKG